MKRHEALIPLSHHHHHALLIAVEMKRAGTEKSKKNYKQLIREMINFWKEDGQNHFRDEEDILFPVYLEYADYPDEDLIKKVLYQHVQIRSLIRHLRENPKASYEKVNELGHLLEDHVRLEERELFPKIEEAVPDPYLYEAKGGFHRDSVTGN